MSIGHTGKVVPSADMHETSCARPLKSEGEGTGVSSLDANTASALVAIPFPERPGCLAQKVTACFEAACKGGAVRVEPVLPPPLKLLHPQLMCLILIGFIIFWLLQAESCDKTD